MAGVLRQVCFGNHHIFLPCRPASRWRRRHDRQFHRRCSHISLSRSIQPLSLSDKYIRFEISLLYIRRYFVPLRAVSKSSCSFYLRDPTLLTPIATKRPSHSLVLLSMILQSFVLRSSQLVSSRPSIVLLIPKQPKLRSFTEEVPRAECADSSLGATYIKTVE